MGRPLKIPWPEFNRPERPDLKFKMNTEKAVNDGYFQALDDLQNLQRYSAAEIERVLPKLEYVKASIMRAVLAAADKLFE
jgi:phosphoribosylpyrophosphate synthetase